LDYVASWHNISCGRPILERRRKIHGETHEKPLETSDLGGAPPSETDAQRTAKAMRTWGETVSLASPAGLIGRNYLQQRVGHALDWPGCIRFHPDCYRRNEKDELERHPALVTLLRDIITNEKRAIHKTFLRPDGTDRLRDKCAKKVSGPQRGTAAKLSLDDAITYGLGICEGVETGLRIIAEGWKPVWACCSSSILGEFPVLSGIGNLSIFGDNDDGGRRAARKTALRWCEAQREAVIITPRQTGADWDDALRSAA
jgi:putative DNA primase/helicase